ncbi:uncharacterized protein LOC124150027 [Haliotis rufescens]|uniref:uncharacterized protein LOC124150027 n=1 Tax=Haliotis rufescens TaxID=6454 RepID=UPI00201E8C8D|nr:uncharacterized protein LOC124150027 [Haliotis rufescens]
MYVAVLSLFILLCGSLSGLILPITKPDGSTDLTSLLSHVTLLEQTVTGLQTTTGQLQSDIKVNKALAAAQISSLTNEVTALKTELRASSNDLAVLKAQMNDVKTGNSNTNSQVNSLSLDVKLNTAQVNTVQSKMKTLDEQLGLVKGEAERLTQNTSYVVQLITHKQDQHYVELQSTKALAQSASKEVGRLGIDMNSTSAGLHLMQNNLSLTSAEVTTLRSDLSVVQKQALDNKQSLTQVSQDIQLVSADVNQTKNSFNLTTLKAALSLASKTRNVAFHVSGPSNTTPAFSTVTFSTLLYNAGSAYNTTTGTFIAPVSGTYMFWTKLEVVESNTNMNVYIMKSGRVYMAGGYMKTDSDIYIADASAVAVNHLNKGEEAWVEISSSHTFYSGNFASYFGGVMLSVD